MRSFILAGAVLASSAVMAADVKFSGDAYVQGYKNQQDTVGTTDFRQRIRVQADLLTKEGVSVHTSVLYSGNNWSGDSANRPEALNPNGAGAADDEYYTVSDGDTDGGNGETLRLDYGYVNIVKNGYVARIGRQKANWGDGFLTNDDRRDRALLMKTFGSVTALAIYDKRSETGFSSAWTEVDSDRGMYALGLVGRLAKGHWGVLGAVWNDSHGQLSLDQVVNISPYITYNIAGVEATAVYSYLGLGAEQSLYRDAGHSMGLRLKKQFGLHKLEAVGVAVIDGGLVAGGYDTLSSVINNTPDHNKSSTNLVNVGGLGNYFGGKDDDDYLAMAKGTFGVSEDFSVALGAGYLKTYSKDFFTKAVTDNKDAVLDVEANYKINKLADAKFTYGKLYGDTNTYATGLKVAVKF